MIGQLLVASRAITQDQLDQALREQGRSGALLGDALVSLRFLTEDGLARALAQEARVPYVSLEGAVPDAVVTNLVPEALARRHQIAPVSRTPNRIRVAQANPFDVVALDEVQRDVELPVEVVCAPRSAIARLIEQSYGQGSSGRLLDLIDEGLAAAAQPQMEQAPEDSPVVRLIEVLVADAVRAGASDLHLEPEEKVIRVRHRVDGVLTHTETIPRELQPPIVSRLKVMAGLDIAEQRLPQEGRITQTVAGRAVDFRVSTFPTVFGEKVAIRILEKDKLVRGSKILA